MTFLFRHGYDLVSTPSSSQILADMTRLKKIKERRMMLNLFRSSTPISLAAKSDIPGVMEALLGAPGGLEAANAIDFLCTPLQVNPTFPPFFLYPFSF